MVEPTDNSTEKLSNSLSRPTGEGIVIDIGTGDGLFVYQCARQNPKKFYIGIDANRRPLAKLSEKTRRKPAKGGLPNLLFVRAAVENLPSELDGVADEVHVHFPWGSLLRAVATGDDVVLRSLRRICASEALLEIVIGIDPQRDGSEIKRLELSPFPIKYIATMLTPRYRAAGFEIIEKGILTSSDAHKLRTSWAKRLRGNANRSLIYIVASAAARQDT